MVNDALGDLAYVETKPGIADPLLDGLFDGINQLFCSSLGPNFLNLYSQQNRCCKESYKARVCNTFETFCEWLVNGGPELQNCVYKSVDNGVMNGDINVNGIIDIRGHIGRCCKIPVSI